MIRFWAICFFFILNCGCTHFSPNEKSSVRVIDVNDVQWEMLNPARGEKSPKAATLWGDRKSNKPTGFLVQFVYGFSSPPHIHNVSYRGIVIDGLIHNDDPSAANMWMPVGSYWTQPAGEAHITSAKGKSNMAFIEIDQGPYLVKPIQAAFDSGERPVNVHASNTVWTLGANDTQRALLWRSSKNHQSAVLLKFSGQQEIHGHSGPKVLIQGKLAHPIKLGSELSPGSVIYSEGSSLTLNCKDKQECVLYMSSQVNP